ncbi:MAG: SpoIIE family protein phosphatase [Verrucomicrobia bacterium]|nr:SpoIIE family protein phosphatase [Verrucomicrobiota bacterium]
MTDNCVKVLLIEDNPDDVQMVRLMLQQARGFTFELECADRLSKGLERLAQGIFDVVLLDLLLTDSRSLDTFVRTRAVAPHIPIVILTVLVDESLATKTLQLGAQDYLLKHELHGPLLVKSLRYAIERKRVQDGQERDRHLLQTLMDNIPDAIYFKDTNSRFVRVNRGLAKKHGFADPGLIEGKTDADMFSEAHAHQARTDEQQVMNSGLPLIGIEEMETWPDGSVTWVSSTKMPLRNPSGRVIGTFGMSRDITKRKVAERALAERTRQLQEKNLLIENELKMARELQQAMLPHAFPHISLGTGAAERTLEFSSVYIPAGAVSGDLFDVVRISDTAVGVFICDVMGHDVRAALVTALLRAEVEERSRLAADPGQLLTQINHVLAGMFKETGVTMFATAFYLVADVARGQFFYANAAHPAAVHQCRRSGKVEPLRNHVMQRSGPALGLLEDAVFNTCQHPMGDGDRVVLFTDGIIEAEANNETAYGHERLMKAIRKRAELPTGTLLQELIADARQFSTRENFADDVCLVALDVKQVNGHGAGAQS